MVRGAAMNEEVNRVEENGEGETQNKPQRGRKRTRNEDNWTRNIKKKDSRIVASLTFLLEEKRWLEKQ